MEKKFNFENSEKYNKLPDTSTSGLSKEDIFSSDDSISELLKTIQENQIKILEKLDILNKNKIIRTTYFAYHTLQGGINLSAGVTLKYSLYVEEIDKVLDDLRRCNERLLRMAIICKGYGAYDLVDGQIMEAKCLHDVEISISEEVTGAHPAILDRLYFYMTPRVDCWLRSINIYVLQLY